jgi:3-methyladenine DNA glycosylase/8-oxoguanine DNA glycosylase
MRSSALRNGFALLVVALTLVTAAGCGGSGQSEADKAKTQVCTSMSDIQTQIDSLKGLTFDTASISKITSSVNTIKTDLNTISDNAGKLADDTRSQVEAANEKFKEQVSTIVSQIASTATASDAQAQFQSAVTTLASAYQSAFSQVKC